MSNTIFHEDFLLQNEMARRLYHQFARELPILDYHNHLPPAEIASNKSFANLTEIWLKGDHYKWRAMRAVGTDENLITGTASDNEKFVAWAEWVFFLLGRMYAVNPSKSVIPLESPGATAHFWNRHLPQSAIC